MGKQNWWETRSAAEDGDWDDDFVDGLWDTYAPVSADVEARVLSSLKLVQGIVDTFATGDKPYRVTFDESVATAGTDFRARNVVISHKPLLDPTIGSDVAQKVVTAMAAHESSHVRYGRDTAAAGRAIPDPRAPRISNLLDDVRIERRFLTDYPGYSGIFGPAIKYVAESALNGKPAYDPAALDDLSIAVAAVRYAAHVDWTGYEGEREFWTDWATRYTANDRTALHVEGVQAAIAHLDAAAAARQAQPEPEQGDDDGDQDGDGETGEQGDETGEPEQAETGSGESADDASDESADDGSGPRGLGIPDCFADGIDDAAGDHGVTDADMSSGYAQELAETVKARVELDDGTTGVVYWGPGGIASVRKPVERDGQAVASIRQAFARSRTGSYGIERDLKSGRLQNRALPRIASNDFRLFGKRQAQSEGKYLVWLLVDCSGSMKPSSPSWWSKGDKPIVQAAQVASALAAASRSVPNLRLDIWGWTSSFRRIGSFGAVRVWKTGDPIANVGYLQTVPNGMTPDEPTVRWAGKAIKQAVRPGEQPVIILASDGMGTLKAETVAAVRRSGVQIVSVAIGSISPERQAVLYGEHGYIPWAGSIRKMARPLGELVARIVTGRAAA